MLQVEQLELWQLSQLLRELAKTEKSFSDLYIPRWHSDCENERFLTISYGLGGGSSAVLIKAH